MTAVAAISAALDRIAADTTNAFVASDPGARTRARLLDASTPDDSPLWGVPVALKDIIDQAGLVTTAGSSFYRHEAKESATVVTRLEAAGAVIVGRTGLHEFAFGFSSENDWFGPVLNPWDRSTSPGGSSGGSAAAVAAGIVPIAIGTDTGGSVRVPAALCGCVGLKVTHGRVPLTGVFPLGPSLDTVGPITRTVAEATATYNAMAGFDSADPWSSPREPESSQGSLPVVGLRIGVPRPWTDRPLEPRIATTYRAVLDRLAAAGATLTEVEAPIIDPREIPRAAYAEVASIHREWITQNPEGYGESIRDRLLADLEHSTDQVTAAFAWRTHLRNGFEAAFQDVDILLTPTTAASRKVIGEETVSIDGVDEPYRPALSWFTSIVNQAGLPAIALPIAGTAARGLPPVSLQMVGPWWSEARLLGWAGTLESSGIVTFTPALT